ncbi:hypothetical protein BSK66_27640 [Paenibacillus odorifer]|uniref:hypothetical protein n=1 Tax=Paenibacillus TaxID=44249 RepID=UPI0003E2100A|nr:MULTISPECIES: hypothetical protein [Paenibacillus]ETT61302.1 hypothetical protein C171_12608 [Paenibacillus sp. FSL H8-237]OMD13730.1 hypothetical protein BJP47_24190 [Paenibacillus odorifer]OME48960.1 hypothetical protein BSK66_27640 [Paenibacillus odorifer]
MYGICKVCGCTDNNACVSVNGPCYWLNKEHDLCSECSDWQGVDISKIPKIDNQLTIQGESYTDGQEVRVILGWDNGNKKIYYISNPVIGTKMNDYKEEECHYQDMKDWTLNE